MTYSVSDATFCAKCLNPSKVLTPLRPPHLPERYATPKFCPTCWPKQLPLPREVVDLTARQWAEQQSLCALPQPYTYLPRGVLRENSPHRVPQFVWEKPGATSVTDLVRGLRYLQTRF